MADTRIRRLEREAQQGDAAARALLAHERARVGGQEQERQDPWKASNAVDVAPLEAIETLTDTELEEAFERVARASSRKHPWLVAADRRFTRLPHGSYSAARRSRALRSS